MRTFKSKPFARWARKEGLNDAGLLDAVDEMEEGNVDVNLGGRVYKKRVALTGRGKRGSVRTLIAYQDGEKVFFMFGFAKKERSNIGRNELKALKLMANDLLGKSDAKLKKP
jgi:hypothetical protein